jgi:hypothetical protein
VGNYELKQKSMIVSNTYNDGKRSILDSNRYKIILISFILLINQSCFQKKEDSKISLEELNNTEKIQPTDSLIINTIKDFYVSYISENSKNEVNHNIINKP